MSALADQEFDMLWQQSLDGLVGIGIDDREARKMVGAALKRGYEANRIRLAIGELRLKPPTRAKQRWAYWWAALKRRKGGV